MLLKKWGDEEARSNPTVVCEEREREDALKFHSNIDHLSDTDLSPSTCEHCSIEMKMAS
jgi:hypothetical protein